MDISERGGNTDPCGIPEAKGGKGQGSDLLGSMAKRNLWHGHWRQTIGTNTLTIAL